jgi:hypothetical protein
MVGIRHSMIMNFKELTTEYFEIFSNKNIDKLAELFDDSIVLRDWDIQKFGKQEVVAANQNIFDSVDAITVTPIKICADGNTTASEISIEVNVGGNIEHLNVVDVIEFSSENKILSVTAYKR